MAEYSSFFNSVSGDRVYTADRFAQYFSALIGNGVFPNPSTGLQATANSGMTIKLPTGKAWINGYFYYNSSDLSLTIDTADGVLHRKDNVVIRYDLSNRSITAVVVKGTPGSSPSAPTLVRTTDQYDLKVAEIYIAAGTTTITNAMITDKRYDSSVCGIVTGTVTQIDASTLYAQFETAFNTWFDEMKGQLSTDAAGNLQNQITAITSTKNQPNGYAGLNSSGKLVQMPTSTDTGSFPAATLIPSNDDLNNAKYKIPGIYYCASNATALTIANRPFDEAFSIIVLPNAFCSQIAVGWVHPSIILERQNVWASDGVGTWSLWLKPDANHADYATGLNPETAPCAVNTLVLPYKTSTIPTGLPNGTFVWRLDVTAP